MRSIGANSLAAAAALALTACATVEEYVDAPQVSLRNVQVEKLDMSAQTFVLSFDVTNPNPFPLPVNSIDYGVRLDGHRFASGEAACDLMVPPGSDGEFAISVDLDLLRTAPELLFLVKDAARRDIPYTLEGSMALSIPATRPVRFAHSGEIRLWAP